MLAKTYERIKEMRRSIHFKVRIQRKQAVKKDKKEKKQYRFCRSVGFCEEDRNV